MNVVREDPAEVSEGKEPGRDKPRDSERQVDKIRPRDREDRSDEEVRGKAGRRREEQDRSRSDRGRDRHRVTGIGGLEQKEETHGLKQHAEAAWRQRACFRNHGGRDRVSGRGDEGGLRRAGEAQRESVEKDQGEAVDGRRDRPVRAPQESLGETAKKRGEHGCVRLLLVLQQVLGQAHA